MGSKGHVTRMAPRMRDVDWGKYAKRHAEKLAKDTALCAFIVKNVRPTGRGDTYLPFTLVGPRTLVTDRLHREYGSAWVGNMVCVGQVEADGLTLDVWQVKVASPIARDRIVDVVGGWDNYDLWRSDLLGQPEDGYETHEGQPEDLHWFACKCDVLKSVHALIARLDRADYERVSRALSTLSTAPSTKPVGQGGRVPVYA